MNAENKSVFENKHIQKIKSFYASYDDNPQEILSSLKGKSDHESIRQQLAILLSMKDYEKAVKLIIKKKINKAWYDLAIVALTNSGYMEKVDELLKWASNREITIWHRAIHLYAMNRFKQIWRNRNKNEEIQIGSLDKTERKELKQLIEDVQPVLKYIEGLGKASSKAQEEVLNVALRSFALLEDKKNTFQYSSYSHDSLTLASLVLCGLINLPKDLISDLESKYPDSYEAQKLAILIRTKYETLKKEDFEEAIRRLTKYSSSKQHKIEIFQILKDIAYKSGEPFIEALQQNINTLLSEDERLFKLFNCEKLLNQKAFSEADKILSETKDENDPVWLQLYGNYLYLMGKTKDALEYSNKARLLLPHPELLHSTAKLAFETGDYSLSIELLKKELENKPDNISLLNNIAAACFRKGDYESAAKYFEKLKVLRTEELSYYLNLASCYAQIGNSQKAIETYDETCKRDDAPLEAYLSRAYLIRISDPIKAFDSILLLKDRYWESPQYLQVVLDLSYRAGKEEYGHQAMLKLLQLQRQGKAPKEILQAKTIEDLKIYINEWNKKVEFINKSILTGKLPWLMSDHWQNHTTYMSWYIRTQPLAWRIEEQLNYASFSIYSTNSFSSVKLSDDTTKLDFIECPAKGTDISIDLSAIITLHRLDLLETCVKYFSKIHIPREYPATLLKDSDNLVIHQRTRKTSAEAIEKTIDNDQIVILEDIGWTGDRPLPFVHEHTLPEKEEEHYYRLIDMIQVAYDTGRLNEEKYKALKRIAHKPSGIDSEHPGLKQGQSIYVDIHTLHSVCQIDIESLVPILNTFRVYISKADQLRNSSDTVQIETQEQLKSWNEQLLQLIRDRDEFIKELHNPVPELQEDDVYFASFWIAKEKSLPLLVDDRVLQVYAINENKAVECPSFGTDRLLLRLYEEKLLDIETLSDAFLTLMKWRYRFIVPTREVLLNLAKRYRNHPPGKDLREIAMYVHDCMRDPGLFGGAENTTQKESIAARLYARWIRTAAEFLVDIWKDTEFTEEAAKLLTEWVINELLPSLPKVLGVNSIRLAEYSSRACLQHFLGYALLIDDTSRANKALQIIAECLSMDEEEYFRTVAWVVDKYGI